MNTIQKILAKFYHWMAYSPPSSLTSKGWRLFEEEFKEKAPIRYFLKHTFMYGFLYKIKWKIQDARRWLRYRLVSRHHVIKTGLKPDYYDVSTKMLYASFNMLKDFVEVEQAWSAYWWKEEYKNEPSYKKFIPFRYIRFRRPDLGVEHFEWASTLDDPNLPPHERMDSQAATAKEVLKLYRWWVNERPNRKDIVIPKFNDQGLGQFGQYDPAFDRTAEDFKAYQAATQAQNDQEEDWNNEDDEMLARLVKIRRGLWT